MFNARVLEIGSTPSLAAATRGNKNPERGRLDRRRMSVPQCDLRVGPLHSSEKLLRRSDREALNRTRPRCFRSAIPGAEFLRCVEPLATAQSQAGFLRVLSHGHANREPL